jgi:hypothetical protein
MVVEGGSKSQVEVKVGTVVDLLIKRPMAIPFELGCAWPDSPQIEGRAVRYCGRRVELPPDDVDGGVETLHYDLAAVAPGQARIDLVPRPASSEAFCPPVRLVVTVRE